MLKLTLESLEDLDIFDSYAVLLTQDYCGQQIQSRLRIPKDQAIAFITTYLKTQDLDSARQTLRGCEDLRPEDVDTGLKLNGSS